MGNHSSKKPVKAEVAAEVAAEVKDEDELEDEVKKALQRNNEALAAAKIQEYLDKEENIPLNIAITGESGSGKSTFVNALRGLDDDDEGAAPTGPVETTMVATPYTHPNFPSVKLWDVPGIGTMRFPAAKYLKLVGLERFDFFIIISCDRFRENDVKLAREIQRMKKKFYFVRSKIDQDIENQKRKRDFNERRILEKIRENCSLSLWEQGFRSPRVFLVSSHRLHLYDFPLLADTLEEELPEHKRDAFLLAMPNTSLEMIDRKKKAFKAKIKYFATLSAAVAAVPLIGLSVAVDIGLLIGVVTRYVYAFGLNIPSLKKMAHYTGVPYEELKKVIKSPLAATKITPDLLLRAVSRTAYLPALMTLQEVSRFIPAFGLPATMIASFTFTYKALNILLEELANDAKQVLKKVLISE